MDSVHFQSDVNHSKQQCWPLISHSACDQVLYLNGVIWIICLLPFFTTQFMCCVIVSSFASVCKR